MNVPNAILSFVSFPGVWAALAFPLGIGLLSGFTHCAAMCGPIHLVLTRRAGRAHLRVFHLGRILTYSALGASAGVLGYSWRAATGSRSAATVWIALYLVLGLRILGVPLWPKSWGIRLGGWIWRNTPVSVPAGERGAASAFFPMGMAAGLLPCATTHAGLAWAAGTGDPFIGALGMVLLGAATLPLFLALPGRVLAFRARNFHLLLGIALIGLAAWKTYGLVFAKTVSCH